MKVAVPCQQHIWFDVGYGWQCGSCGLTKLKSETSSALRQALIDSGVYVCDVELETKN